jgi:hypothetical protein
VNGRFGPDEIDIFFEIKRGRISDTGAFVERHHSHVIADFVLLRIAKGMVEGWANGSVRSPGQTTVIGPCVIEFRLAIIRAVAGIVPAGIEASVGSDGQSAKPMSGVLVERIVV